MLYDGVQVIAAEDRNTIEGSGDIKGYIGKEDPILPPEAYFFENPFKENVKTLFGAYENFNTKKGIKGRAPEANFYRRYLVDLSSKAGQKVLVGFYLVTEDVGEVSTMLMMPGIYIDDVKIVKGSIPQ